VKIALKLQGKITALILTVVLLVFIVIIGAVTSMNRTESIEQARLIAVSRSQEYANEMRTILEVALESARTLARVLEGLTESEATDREQVAQILAGALRRNPAFLGVWSCWEPNAFDGRDSEFADTEGHDATGRFIPYWYRQGGEILFEPLEGYDNTGENDYYLIPMRTGRETILEPYYEDQLGDQKKLITSLVIPVESKGKRAGVVGVDVAMDNIHEITNRLQLYDTGFGRLISHGGIVASHKDPRRIGEQAGELTQQGGENILKRIQAGESWFEEAWSESLQKTTLKAFAPVRIGNTGTPWSFGAVILENEVMASSQRILFITILIAGIGILLIVAAVWLIARWIVKPLRKVLELAARAQDGDLMIGREDFGIRSHDELGAMADGLAEMIRSQAETILRIRKVAEDVSATAEALASLSEETNASIEEVRSNLDQASDLSESNSASIEETTAGVQEVAGSAQTMAKAANEGASAGEKAGKTAAASVEKVNSVVRDLGFVGEKSKESIEAISRLAAAVKDIAGFVGIISSIADQTNLLALNAAIEAARAGDAGRGFAVVADEVRKLAEDSNKAAAQVSKLIGTLENNTKGAIGITEEAGKIMKETVSRAEEAGRELQVALKEIGRVIDAIGSIASTSEEQAASSQEMASAMDQITQGTMKIAGLIRNISNASEETSKAAEGVAHQAQVMNAGGEELLLQISRFKVRKSASEGGLVPAAQKKK